MDTVYITFLIGIIIWSTIWSTIGISRESFILQSSNKGIRQINPPHILPPGYTNMNYKFKNSKKPIWSQTDYCHDNPRCYPCYGWTKIGAPECLQR